MSEQYSTPAWAEPEWIKRARQLAQLTTRDVLPDLIGWRSRRKLDQRDSAARKIIWELLCALGLQLQRADELECDNQATNAALDDARKQIVRMGPVYNGHDAAMLVATKVAAETGRYILYSSVQEDGTAIYQLNDGTLVQHALPGFGPHTVTVTKDDKTVALNRVSPSGVLDETDVALIKLLLADPEPQPTNPDDTGVRVLKLGSSGCANPRCPVYSGDASLALILDSALWQQGLDPGEFSLRTRPDSGSHCPFGCPGSDACGNC